MEDKILFKLEYRNLLLEGLLFFLSIIMILLGLLMMTLDFNGQLWPYSNIFLGLVFIILPLILIIYLFLKENLFKIKIITITSHHMERTTKNRLVDHINFKDITKIITINKRVIKVFIVYYIDRDKKTLISLSSTHGITEHELKRIYEIVLDKVDLTKVEVIEH
jgi:hypothetical protein